VVQEERQRGSWQSGKTPTIGGWRRCRETKKGKQEEEDEDPFVNFAKVKISFQTVALMNICPKSKV
jgi:hypothetical protein